MKFFSLLFNKVKINTQSQKIQSFLQEYYTKASKTFAFWRKDESNQQILHRYKIEIILTSDRTQIRTIHLCETNGFDYFSKLSTLILKF